MPLFYDSHTALSITFAKVGQFQTPTGELLYRNAWATDHAMTPATFHACGLAAPTRSKSENDNNNVLKNYGNHLEHNFDRLTHYIWNSWRR